MNKKGSIVDPIIWIIVSFVTVVFLVLIVFLFMKISDVFMGIRNNPNVNVDVEGAVNKTFGQVTPQVEMNMKWIIWVILLAMALSIFVHNFLIKISPWFFGLYILICIAAIIISVPFSNAYEDLLKNPTLGSTFQSYTAATYIMLYLPVYTAVISLIGFIFLIIGYVRNRDQQENMGGDSSIII